MFDVNWSLHRCRIVALVLVGAAMVLPGAASSAPARSPMAVLTPAVPDTFVVYAGDVFIPAESLLDSKKNDKLRKLAQSSGFSVADRLRAQVLAVLRKDGWDAVEMDMTRAAVGTPVRRESYPADSNGRLMLDVKVQLVGLVAGWGRLSSYRPDITVSYRLLTKDARLLRPSLAIYYCHAGFHCAPGATPSRMATVDDKSDCTFANFSAVENEPARMWACFDSAFVKIAEKLVADLDESGVE
jgi:hypothetical protein